MFVLSGLSRFPGGGWCPPSITGPEHRQLCSFLIFKSSYSTSSTSGSAKVCLEMWLLGAEGSPPSLAAHPLHLTQCISRSIHQTLTVHTWCWCTGFHPEKINKPNQTHSPLKTLINLHHRPRLYRNGKSHCPVLCLEKLGQAAFLGLPRAR